MQVRQIASIAALALLVPSAAHAQSTAPPGSAAVDQYREQAPPTGAKGRKLSKDRRRDLESRGPEGRALADALDRTGGVPASGSDASGETAARPTTDSDEGSRGERGERSAPEGGGRDDDARRSSEADPSDGAAAGGTATTREPSLAESSATSTVGGLPVWGLLVGALAIVGVGAAVRGRRAS